MTHPERPVRAVVLLSGGLDSATALAIARSERRECHALSLRYGQRHEIELAAASNLARALGASQHLILDLPLDRWGGSALTGDFEVPKDRASEELGSGIPITYVPARNTVFLALALAWSETLGAEEIWIGVNALDYSGYPDCRPEFIRAFEEVARLGTKAGVEGNVRLSIRAPLQFLTKAEIIRKGIALGVDYSLTRSCYDPPTPDLHCGRCDSCLLRKKGFAEAGVEDPTRYAAP
ncbi:MAG: 7-cyano-7-deazaguanine synthase [bacterium]|nr:7-cyano-7-deazaguanine synthase [bacterium]